MKSKKWGLVVVTVDDDDAWMLRQMVWTVSGANSPVVIRRIDGMVTTLGRAIMNPKPSEWVRHANGCYLDFRKDNLVVCADRKQLQEAE